MHGTWRMLSERGQLLPAVAVAALFLGAAVAAQPAARAISGAWTTTTANGVAVTTHDPKGWKGAGFPLALFDEPKHFANGTVRVQFRLVGGKDDYTAGLVFGHQPGGTYFFVRYNTKDGNVALWRMDGPTRTVVKHGDEHAQLELGAWHDLQLTVDGRRVRASVNGTLHVEHELDQPVAGRLGLWTKPDASSAFRNVLVRPKS
jgi:hypothetical protein